MDSISPKDVRETAKVIPDLMLKVMYKLFVDMRLPGEWKMAKLVLLLKGIDKPMK